MQIIYFEFKDFYVSFMTLQSIGFKFFAKMMKGSCVFYCSSCISFNPTSHLNVYKAKSNEWTIIKIIKLTNTIHFSVKVIHNDISASQ